MRLACLRIEWLRVVLLGYGMPLVLIRVPTYRRLPLLKRAISCLQAQTHQDWICEIRDDCPDGSARVAVEEAGDPRIRYVHNSPQKFMVKNLNDCFLRDNPHGADYFYMLEDDNQIFPEFLARGCDILQQTGLNICQLNQLIEHRDDPDNPHIGTAGIFDDIYDERAYQPSEFRLSLFGGVGISHGSVLWSKNIKREMTLSTDIIPALDEVLRTIMLEEPIYICREHLAVWAKNEATTERNIGFKRSQLKREIDLKASMAALRRSVWNSTPPKMQNDFLYGGVLRLPVISRLQAMKQAEIPIPGIDLGLKTRVRRKVVQWTGQVSPILQPFM